MKRIIALCAALIMSAALVLPAFAADSEVCYPVAVQVSEDGKELKRIYDLPVDADPAGIPRSDFDRGGFHYTLVEILRQELPTDEERQHTETVTLESEKKDMESVLALLPQEKDFVTDDGLAGTLTLKLDTVRVEASGYGSTTRRVTATRSYPNLIGQDTQYIPKSIEDSGRTLTLESIDWQTDNTANVDGYGLGDRYTAVATYAGSATSSYVKGYTITADYTGTVARVALDRVRYVAIFEGTRIAGSDEIAGPAEEIVIPTERTEPEQGAPAQFPWRYVLIPVGLIAAAGAGIGVALGLKRRSENASETEVES